MKKYICIIPLFILSLFIFNPIKVKAYTLNIADYIPSELLDKQVEYEDGSISSSTMSRILEMAINDGYNKCLFMEYNNVAYNNKNYTINCFKANNVTFKIINKNANDITKIKYYYAVGDTESYLNAEEVNDLINGNYSQEDIDTNPELQFKYIDVYSLNITIYNNEDNSTVLWQQKIKKSYRLSISYYDNTIYSGFANFSYDDGSYNKTYSNFNLIDYNTNEIIETSSTFQTNKSIKIAPGESIMFYPNHADKSDYSTYFTIDGYYYTELIHYNNEHSDYEVINYFSNIPVTQEDVSNNNDEYVTISFLEEMWYPYYVYHLVNRDSVPITFNYNSNDMNVYSFTTDINEVYDYVDGQQYKFTNISSNLMSNSNLNMGSTNGSSNVSSSSNPFSSLASLLENIVGLVRLFGTVFVVIGSLMTIFFASMPSFISIGLQAVFLTGLILLVIKALK